MKIQILRQDQKPIEGYQQITVDRNSLDLATVSDNECEFILAPDVLDSFSGDGAGQVIQALYSKLRLGGTLVIGGTDVRLFSKAVLNGAVGVMDASNIVTNCHAMTSVEMTKVTLQGLGLFINSTSLDGLHYELKATRQV